MEKFSSAFQRVMQKVKLAFSGPKIWLFVGALIVVVAVAFSSCQGLVNANGTDNEIVISRSDII